MLNKGAGSIGSTKCSLCWPNDPQWGIVKRNSNHLMLHNFFEQTSPCHCKPTVRHIGTYRTVFNIPNGLRNTNFTIVDTKGVSQAQNRVNRTEWALVSIGSKSSKPEACPPIGGLVGWSRNVVHFSCKGIDACGNNQCFRGHHDATTAYATAKDGARNLPAMGCQCKLTTPSSRVSEASATLKCRDPYKKVRLLSLIG